MTGSRQLMRHLGRKLRTLLPILSLLFNRPCRMLQTGWSYQSSSWPQNPSESPAAAWSAWRWRHESHSSRNQRRLALPWQTVTVLLLCFLAPWFLESFLTFDLFLRWLTVRFLLVFRSKTQETRYLYAKSQCKGTFWLNPWRSRQSEWRCLIHQIRILLGVRLAGDSIRGAVHLTCRILCLESMRLWKSAYRSSSRTFKRTKHLGSDLWISSCFVGSWAQILHPWPCPWFK